MNAAQITAMAGHVNAGRGRWPRATAQPPGSCPRERRRPHYHHGDNSRCVKKGDTIEPTVALQRLYRDTEIWKTGISCRVKVPLEAELDAYSVV